MAEQETFNYTGSSQIWEVPAGVTEIVVDMYGAEGDTAAFASGTPGRGARVQTTISVTPGQMLDMRVGGQNGFNGGGADDGFTGNNGGGASDIRPQGGNAASRLAVAGGGGGAGSALGGGGAGNGGNAGQNGTNGTNGSGSGASNGGGGGTQSAGGSGGSGGGGNGGSGSLGQGGNAVSNYAPGGGGGGGYYGGGAGGTTSGPGGGSGGGGGGSSMSTGTNTTFTSGARQGNGQITITYEPAASVPLFFHHHARAWRKR